MTKLSIIMPVYNEKNTILEIIRRVKAVSIAKELIIVDDGSTDGTKDLLAQINDPEIKILYHAKNMGKGAAIRTALPECSGEIILIQDADLEYDPKDYPALLAPILDGRADVVYGSRFLGGPHRVLFFWHYFGNLLFTLITNILYNINLTDMGTCYKAFKSEVLQSLQIKSNGFGFEPEITAKVCKKKVRLYETPVSYAGRTYSEGKKITWKDGWIYLWVLFRHRISS